MNALTTIFNSFTCIHETKDHNISFFDEQIFTFDLVLLIEMPLNVTESQLERLINHI